MSDYTKLSNLVDDTFTVQKVFGYKFKMWDAANNKMLISDTWVKDYQKKYTIDTDKGALDLSSGQMGGMLEAVTQDGRSDINGRTFSVKANMTAEQFAKASQEDKKKIRYYINATKDAPAAPVKATEPEFEEPFDMTQIPF